MKNKELQEILKRSKFEEEILELISDQTSEYNNTDGVDRSYTQSDLQGRVSAIVLGIIEAYKR